MKATSETIDLGGGALHVRHWPRAAGSPVLALHCALSHGGEWSALAGACPGLVIHAPDLVGHGRMPAWEGADAGQGDPHGQSTDLAVALAAHLGQGQGRPVDVIGHSFGGTVALRLALQAPHLVRRLILVEPVIFAAARNSAAWPGFVGPHRAVEAMVAAGDLDGALKAFLAIWGAGEDVEALVPDLRSYMRARIPLVMAIDDILVNDSAGLLDPGRLEALACPVLLVEGGDSPAVIGAVMAELARRLPQARRAVVPGSGHMVPVTHAAALAALVRDFLGPMGEP